MSKNTQIYSNLTLPNTLSLEKALNEKNCVIKLEYLLVLHSFTLHLFEQNASLKIVLVIGLKPTLVYQSWRHKEFHYWEISREENFYEEFSNSAKTIKFLLVSGPALSCHHKLDGKKTDRPLIDFFQLCQRVQVSEEMMKRRIHAVQENEEKEMRRKARRPS